MTRDEASAILDLPREQAIELILCLAEKAEKFDLMHPEIGPTTPSAMTPPYLKAACGKRKKKPGRPAGHPGCTRPRPSKVDAVKPHELCHCPECGGPVKKSIRQHRRLIEDIPNIEPLVTEHVVHGYWCSRCKKIVTATLTDAFPNGRIGLRLIVFTAWLHYLVGVSVDNPGLDALGFVQRQDQRRRIDPGLEQAGLVSMAKLPGSRQSGPAKRGTERR